MEKEQIVNELFASYVNTLKSFSDHASKYLNETITINNNSISITDKIKLLSNDINKEIISLENQIEQNKITFAQQLSSLVVVQGSISLLEQSLMLTNRLAILKTVLSVFTDINKNLK